MPSILAVVISIVIVAVAVMCSTETTSFGNETTVGPYPSTNPFTFLQALSAFVFAFKSSIFMELLAEMKVPKQFPRSLTFSFGLMSCTYMFVVVVAYGYKGSSVPGFLPDILSEGPAKIAADVLLLLHIIIAYVVVSQPLHVWFHSKIFPKTLYQDTFSGQLHWFLICFGFVAFSWLIANLIPFFAEVQSLIGSLFGAPIMFGWPALFYVLSCRQGVNSWKETISHMGWMRAVLCGLFLFVFLPLFLILGTGGAIWSIVESIQDSPSPFSC